MFFVLWLVLLRPTLSLWCWLLLYYLQKWALCIFQCGLWWHTARLKYCDNGSFFEVQNKAIKLKFFRRLYYRLWFQLFWQCKICIYAELFLTLNCRGLSFVWYEPYILKVPEMTTIVKCEGNLWMLESYISGFNKFNKLKFSFHKKSWEILLIRIFGRLMIFWQTRRK